ncbi:hypothetical protein KJ640_08510 [bacterium]|nr:hypothetical protein [bacterium]
MEIKDILIVVLPLVTAAVLGYYFSKKKEIELKINEEKTRRYENLITYLSRGFMDSDTSDNDKVKNKKIGSSPKSVVIHRKFIANLALQI